MNLIQNLRILSCGREVVLSDYKIEGLLSFNVVAHDGSGRQIHVLKNCNKNCRLKREEIRKSNEIGNPTYRSMIH